MCFPSNFIPCFSLCAMPLLISSALPEYALLLSGCTVLLSRVTHCRLSVSMIGEATASLSHASVYPQDAAMTAALAASKDRFRARWAGACAALQTGLQQHVQRAKVSQFEFYDVIARLQLKQHWVLRWFHATMHCRLTCKVSGVTNLM